MSKVIGAGGAVGSGVDVGVGVEVGKGAGVGVEGFGEGLGFGIVVFFFCQINLPPTFLQINCPEVELALLHLEPTFAAEAWETPEMLRTSESAKSP